MTVILQVVAALMAAASGVVLVVALAVIARLLLWLWRVLSWLDGK